MGKQKKTSQKNDRPAELSKLLRLPSGPVDLSEYDTRATPGFPGPNKDSAPQLAAALAPELSDLQERLFATSRVAAESARSVLLVLQGMDTSGKGGVIRHAIGMVDPQGVSITAFKQPTAEEKRHPFLWRIKQALPDPGYIGIFDRSHYEDVLIARVNELVPKSVWSRRYAQINRFEQGLVSAGVTVIKCYLHISSEEQRARLADRLSRQDKWWKFNPGDIVERRKWPDYQVAYQDALSRCNTDAAPWYLIPADRKWYRNWAVAELLKEHLVRLNPQWPEADFVVAEQQKLLAAT